MQTLNRIVRLLTDMLNKLLIIELFPTNYRVECPIVTQPTITVSGMVAENQHTLSK